MKMAKGAVAVPPSAIVDISGDPGSSQTVVLEQGAETPDKGGFLEADATSSFPGLLGKVIGSSQLSNGRTRLSLEPAALDQVYSQFELHFDGFVGDLAGPVVATSDGATSSSAASISRLSASAFSCTGPHVEKPDIEVDLTPLRIASDINVQRRQVAFLVSGKPRIKLSFKLNGGASCRLNQNIKVFIPVAGPVGIDLAPVLDLSAGADSQLDFVMEPGIAVGFSHGSLYNQDFRTLNPNRPSLNLHGSLGVDAFAGGSIGVSVGGRAGVRGKFGPALGARTRASAGQVCADVGGALRIALDAYANVFIADLTFHIAKGDFLQQTLYSNCAGGGGAGGGGGSGSGGGSGGPGGKIPGPSLLYEKVVPRGPTSGPSGFGLEIGMPECSLGLSVDDGNAPYHIFFDSPLMAIGIAVGYHYDALGFPNVGQHPVSFACQNYEGTEVSWTDPGFVVNVTGPPHPISLQASTVSPGGSLVYKSGAGIGVDPCPALGDVSVEGMELALDEANGGERVARRIVPMPSGSSTESLAVPPDLPVGEYRAVQSCFYGAGVGFESRHAYFDFVPQAVTVS